MASETNTMPVPETAAASNDNTGGDVNPSPVEQGKPETDNLPSIDLQRKVENYPVFDRTGKEHPFKSLYSGSDSAHRVLVIFVRHFFCGSCQEYLRTLSETIKPETLSHPSINTSIAIIGCGDPGLIDHYSNETGCPFPIFSDPTRKLFDEIGLTTSYAWGSHPEYIRKSMFQIVTGSIMQGLKQVSSGLATKGGNTTQIGGEFLFESTTSGSGEGKEITWCHRMKNTRDHTEISELVRVLGLDGLGQPLKE